MRYSVIIPVYNCENYLEECVYSIIKQNIRDIEILLIDDGSPDQSGFIADQLQEDNSCVKTYHKMNGGAASARNYGLTKSQGEYILFIDGDDTVADGTLKTIDKIIQDNKVDMVTYGMSFDYYDGEQIRRTEELSCNYSGYITKKEVNQQFYSFFIDNALSSACNKVFQKNMIDDYDIYFKEGMTLYEDFDFVLQYLSHCESIYFIAQPYYHYRLDLNNLHIYDRIRDLEKITINLKRLISTMESYMNYDRNGKGDNSVLLTGINLSLQLLDQHLYHNDINEELIYDFIYLSGIQECIQKYNISLENSEKVLYERICNRQFGQIRLEILIKKRKNQLKHFIKKTIGRR